MTSPIERAFDEVCPVIPDLCPSCKGPNPKANHVLLVPLDEPVPECPECGGVIHEDGSSARRLSGPVFLIRPRTRGSWPTWPAGSNRITRIPPGEHSKHPSPSRPSTP